MRTGSIDEPCYTEDPAESQTQKTLGYIVAADVYTVIEPRTNSTESGPAGNRSYGLYCALLFLVAPFVVLSLPGLPHWIGRIVAISIFTFLLPFACFWYGLNPKTVMIGPRGKLARPEFASVRPKVERGMRIMTIMFALFFLIVLTRPFAMDLIQLLHGKRPTIMSAVPIQKHVPLFGLWFVEQSVRFVRGENDYSLFYSMQPLRVGKEYQFVILPRSRMIIDFRQVGR